MLTYQVERFLQCLTIVRSIAGILLEVTYKRNLALGAAHILPASVPRIFATRLWVPLATVSISKG
jgi:hypothetical protein